MQAAFSEKSLYPEGFIDDAGNSSNDQTAYAYEIAGEYSFDLTFPIAPDMSYSRVASMSGSETKLYL